MPFLRWDSPADAVIVLRVDGPTTFVVVEGFRYVDRYDDNREYCVPACTGTDLASVPFFLQWLVRSYGRHTNAAIVHDHLWRTKSVTMCQANTVFRHAMWELEVPFVRRWFMWAAVTLGMLAQTRWGAVQLSIWGAGLISGVAVLFAMNGYELTSPAAFGTAAAALIVADSTMVARSVWTGAKAQRLASIVAGVAAGLSAVTVLVYAVMAAEWLGEHGLPVSAALVGVGLLAWTRSIRAGIVASLAALFLVVPLTGVALGLVAYGIFEVTGLGVTWLARRVKEAIGCPVIGTLNPLTSDTLRTSAGDDAGVSFAASQA